MNTKWKTSIRIIKGFLPSIGVGLALTLALLWLRPSIWLIEASIFIIGLVLSVYKKSIIPMINSLQGMAFVFFIYVFYKLFGGYGVLAVVIICVLVVVWLLYRRWNLFIKTIKELELMIWGKTNDRKR